MSELCSRCGKEPVYEREGKKSVLGARCFLDVLAELFSEPQIGFRAYCSECGERIEYDGEGWYHIKWRPLSLHRAVPEGLPWLDGETQELIAWLQSR